jgi:hypothetical protein
MESNKRTVGADIDQLNHLNFEDGFGRLGWNGIASRAEEGRATENPAVNYGRRPDLILSDELPTLLSILNPQEYIPFALPGL